jgi:hypothetical protein
VNTIHPDKSSVATSPAVAFALSLETACSTFATLHDLVAGDLQLIAPAGVGTTSTSAAADLRIIGTTVAAARVKAALAHSFVFYSSRAHRICKENKADLDIDREERKRFLNAIKPVIDVRDVNEHGFDRNSKPKSRPSMHSHGDLWTDELSLGAIEPKRILMGPINLYTVYLAVEHMRKLAGFHTLPRSTSGSVSIPQGAIE